MTHPAQNDAPCDHDWRYFAALGAEGGAREGVECRKCHEVDE